MPLLLLASDNETTTLRYADLTIWTIEALGTIQPSGPFERALARLLTAAYKCHLRGIVEIAPTWVRGEILSASERIEDRRAVVWMPAQCFDFYPEWQYTMCA